MGFSWKAVECENVSVGLTWERCPGMKEFGEEILLCYWGRILVGEVACTEPYRACFGSDEPINKLLIGTGFKSVNEAKGAVELEFRRQVLRYVTDGIPEAD